MYDDQEFLEADVQTQTKMHKDYRMTRAERLLKLGAPAIIVENEKKIGKMSYPEWQTHCKNIDIEIKKEKEEYAKNNKLNPKIVKIINDWLDENLEKLDYVDLLSDVNFHMALHPLKFMSQEDFDHDLYEHIWLSRRLEQLKKKRRELEELNLL